MNKSDIKLIIIIILIAIIVLFMIAILNNNSNKKALVYYDNNLVLTIDLTEKKEKKEYLVDGYNGVVKIIVEDGKIKVDEEDSPLHLCSKQGFIAETYETIVCLPNKIIIKIVSSKDNNLDTILR